MAMTVVYCIQMWWHSVQ